MYVIVMSLELLSAVIHEYQPQHFCCQKLGYVIVGEYRTVERVPGRRQEIKGKSSRSPYPGMMISNFNSENTHKIIADA